MDFLCDYKWSPEKIETLMEFMTKVVGRSKGKTPYQVEFNYGKESTLQEYLMKYLTEVLNNEQSSTKPNFPERHPCSKK